MGELVPVVSLVPRETDRLHAFKPPARGARVTANQEGSSSAPLGRAGVMDGFPRVPVGHPWLLSFAPSGRGGSGGPLYPKKQWKQVSEKRPEGLARGSGVPTGHAFIKTR